MSNGMRIDGRSLPLPMQEQVAMAYIKKGKETEKPDRMSKTLIELVDAIKEKYTNVSGAVIHIGHDKISINIIHSDSRRTLK